MKRRDPPQKRGSVTPLPGKGSKSDSKDASATQTSKSRKRSSSPWFSYLKKFALVLFVVYISAPFTIRLFPVLLSKVVYLNMVRVPFFVDTRYPEDVLNHTSNFYLTPEEGITVGVWHTVPASRGEEAKGKDHGWFEAALSDNNPVIIYLHGNGGTRAVDHRVQLIKVLSAAGFHVLSIDYRGITTDYRATWLGCTGGFADSTGEPSEEGVTNDSAYLYEWVKARSRGSPVCLWGHSLGTGIATNAARRLQEKGNAPDGVILEAPYTNIREAGAYHPFGKIYHIFPGFEYFFLDTFALSNNVFPNDQNVKIMSSPLLILHAEDDQVVPSAMAKKLHEIALTSPHSRQVKLVLYPAEHGYKHKFIYKDPELPGIIWAFLNAI